MSAKMNSGGGVPNGGLGWLVEAVFLSALIAGWSYFLSMGGPDAFSGLTERLSPKHASADGQPAAADSGRELGTAQTGKMGAKADKSKLAVGGTERRSVDDVLGGTAFSGVGSGALQVSLKASSNTTSPPVIASAPAPIINLALTSQTGATAPRALEADAAPAQMPQPDRRRTPAEPTPPAKVGPPTTLLLSNVSGRLADRNDLSVSMSIVLRFNENSALRQELEFKRDVLATIAGAALRRHEYGNVNTAILRADILDTFNKQLRAGKLSGVDIKDFLIGTPGGGS